MHLQQILACGVACFKEHHTDTNLTPTIETFALSDERQKMMDYGAYALRMCDKRFLRRASCKTTPMCRHAMTRFAMKRALDSTIFYILAIPLHQLPSFSVGVQGNDPWSVY